jgi:hypothetical protein
MCILATVQKTQPDTSAAEIDTLLHLHFIHMQRNENFHMWLHNKIKGPVFQDKTHGQVHTHSHITSPHMQTKNCFKVKNKKL